MCLYTLVTEVLVFKVLVAYNAQLPLSAKTTHFVMNDKIKNQTSKQHKPD